MERCPTCQARLKDASVCPRCKTDLSRPLSIQAQADAWLQRAFALLAEGKETQAMDAVEASLRFKREPLALLVKGFLIWRGEPGPEKSPVPAPHAPEPSDGGALQSGELTGDFHGPVRRLLDLASTLAEVIWRTVRHPLFPLLENPPDHRHD
jgi:hypothetical protein